MQNFALTITAILHHATGVHAERTVTTATGGGYRSNTYRELGQQIGQLANGLRRLGITGDQRVATFMWNNTEHLASYLAVPAMDAVLHTLSIWLFGEQIVYIANEAEDQIVLVDLSSAESLAPVLAEVDTLRTVIAVGDGETAPLEESGKAVRRYSEVLSAESPGLVLCGGSAVPVSLMRAFEQRYGVRVLQAWGMTETSPLATVAWPPPGTPDDRYWALRGTQGQAVCGVEARIVDDNGAVLPNDDKSVGEIEVRGGWIAGGYYRGRDESKFPSGWFRTGDVGYMDSQRFVTLTDRAKDVIKSGGEWLSSVELENELIAHPDVVEAAVVGVPDERWQERPLAAVVKRAGTTVTVGELRAFLADKVARWWLPERWTFVDEIPRTRRQEDDPLSIRRQRLPGDRDPRLSAMNLRLVHSESVDAAPASAR